MEGKKLVKRQVTLDEFIQFKNVSPAFKTARNRSKNVNFSFLFGGGAYNFAMSYLKKTWSVEDCITYLEESKIPYKEYDDENDYYLAVAKDIRNKFFESYPGLLHWIDRVHAEAEINGYVRSPFGARRLLPFLSYKGQDTDLGEYNHYMNIAVNSPVQNFEAVVVVRAIKNILDDFTNKDLKSKIFVTIHDAIGFYIHKDELDVTYDIIMENAERDYPEFDGIPFEFELDIADPESANPSYWGFGKEWKKEKKS